ncbi:hypothetical protein [Mangrovibacillus cuniculi]|nr:hypothetical protein [Mangrovibacillus cuniculi]
MKLTYNDKEVGTKTKSDCTGISAAGGRFPIRKAEGARLAAAGKF